MKKDFINAFTFKLFVFADNQIQLVLDTVVGATIGVANWKSNWKR